jgi:Domain of unknown function (DUF1874).
MLYILNSATLPLKEGGRYLIKARELSAKEASDMLKKEQFISAVGHEATAKALSNIFGVEVPFNRIQITLQPGDKLISITLKRRLEEGKVIRTIEELNTIGYSIWLFEVYEDKEVSLIQEVERFLIENPGIV